jgi:hypothetical protein
LLQGKLHNINSLWLLTYKAVNILLSYNYESVILSDWRVKYFTTSSDVVKSFY